MLCEIQLLAQFQYFDFISHLCYIHVYFTSNKNRRPTPFTRMAITLLISMLWIQVKAQQIANYQGYLLSFDSILWDKN